MDIAYLKCQQHGNISPWLTGISRQVLESLAESNGKLDIDYWPKSPAKCWRSYFQLSVKGFKILQIISK